MIRQIVSLLLFLATLQWLPQSGALWSWLFPDLARPVYAGTGWFALLGSHLVIAAAAGLVAVLLGLAAGIIVTRPWGRGLRPLVDAVFAVAQATPPVAVLALALPMAGFGAAPTIVALVLYSSLPVLRAAAGGLDSVPPAVVDAARGLGMSRAQRLREVELPLAAPAILSGIRVAVTLAIATTAVGAVVGAEGLGTPIVVGLANNNPAYVLQGALLTAWLALLADGMIGALAARLARGRARPERTMATAEVRIA